MPKTDEERRAFLKTVGLNADAPGLADAPVAVVAATTEPASPAKRPSPRPKPEAIRLAPDGVDPRVMRVSDIVFDPRLLDGYDLHPTRMKAASDHVFALYKSYGRDKDRNGLLHRAIGEFIKRERVRRVGDLPAKPQPVKEKVKATREQRDIAQLFAEHGLTLDDAVRLLGQQ